MPKDTTARTSGHRTVPSRGRLLATVQRRRRTVTRLATLSLDPRLYPTCRLARTYWWTNTPNFGDEIGPLLLRSAGIAPLLKPRKEAEVFTVGSLLELVPQTFSGIIWGSGKMHRGDVTSLPHATILALRGELTRAALGHPPVALGDPGLLLPDLIAPPGRGRGIAVVPHFSHRDEPWLDHLMNRLGPTARIVDVGQAPRVVARDIAAAAQVMSTSLHGLIVADGLGIPALWALPDPVVSGRDFKFVDHESVVLPDGGTRRCSIDDISHADFVLRQARTPDPRLLAQVKTGLRQSLAQLRDLLPVVTPWSLPAHQMRP